MAEKLSIPEVRDKILIQCYSIDIPPKIKAHIDSLLRRIRCEACEKIMGIEDLVYVHKDKGIADNGDINYVCGHNKGIGKAKSIIKEKR